MWAGGGCTKARLMRGLWHIAWFWLAVGLILASQARAGDLAFTVKRLAQIQTFEASDGFQLALLVQTAGMNLRLNKLTGRIKRHEHPLSQHFLYLITGQIELTVGGETTTIGTGDFVTIPRGSLHSMRRLGDAEALFLDIASPPDVGDVVWHE